MIAEFDEKKTSELPDRNIILVGAERFHCVEKLFQASFTDKEASGLTTILSSTTRSVRLTSARICTPMSCRQVARPRSKGPVSA